MGCSSAEDPPDEPAPVTKDECAPLAEHDAAAPRSSLPSAEVLAEATATSPTSCAISIDPAAQLFITHLSVVNDPRRTNWTGDLTDPDDGAWSFNRLMAQMAGDQDPRDFVRSWLAQWESDFEVNGERVPARNRIADAIITPWLSPVDGKLDLTQTHFRLQAIVNRFDLRAAGDAGELRFIFSAITPPGHPLPVMVALEYRVPAASQAEVRAWAHAWRALGEVPLGSATYLASLQALTDRVTARGAVAKNINGSAISQVRTNEEGLEWGWIGEWDMREFHLTQEGQLRMAPLAQTPRQDVSFTPLLNQYLKENFGAVLQQKHVVPATFACQPFAAGHIKNTTYSHWSAMPPMEPLVAERFAQSTCNGCHTRLSSTPFLQVVPRQADQEAGLSTFIEAQLALEQPPGTPPNRVAILKSFLCANP